MLNYIFLIINFEKLHYLRTIYILININLHKKYKKQLLNAQSIYLERIQISKVRHLPKASYWERERDLY
jgi:hypothetical protein